MSVALLLGSGFGLGAGALFGNIGAFGWRITWMIGPISGVLYLILYNSKGIDPERGRAEAGFEDFEGSINYDYKLTLTNVAELFKKKYLIAFFIFQLFNSFSAATMGTWGIRYLTEFRLGDEVVATFFTICVGLFALPGSFLGGFLGDRYYRSGKLNMRIIIAMSGMIIGTISNMIYYLLPLGIPSSLIIIVIMACSAMFFANLHVGNGFAMISEVCVPELRSSAHALNGLFVNLGNVIGNLIFSSIITADWSLMPFAIGLVYTVTLLGSFLWIVPYFQYPKDAESCDELMSERRKEIESKKVI
jgi:MFS family permease